MADAPAVRTAGWPLTAYELACCATAAHWELEELAYLIGNGQVTRERLDRAADGLEALVDLLRKHQP